MKTTRIEDLLRIPVCYEILSSYSQVLKIHFHINMSMKMKEGYVSPHYPHSYIGYMQIFIPEIVKRHCFKIIFSSGVALHLQKLFLQFFRKNIFFDSKGIFRHVPLCLFNITQVGKIAVIFFFQNLEVGFHFYLKFTFQFGFAVLKCYVQGRK